jgi:epoxyqueuosine reductase
MANLFRCIDSFFSQQTDVLEWGVASPEPLEHPEKLERWLVEKKHGEMAYMQEHLAMRINPQQFMPEAESILLFLHRYPEQIPESAGALEAQVAAYARGVDYHHTIKGLVRELEQQLVAMDPDIRLKAFVDSAPVMERDLAVRAGLGWLGKNGLLLHQQYGSQFFIGGFFLNRKIEKTLQPQRDACGSCRKCIDACPTSAIEETRQVDASRCISYLTIEKKGEIEKDLSRKMGNRIFGCDTCQQVCPWNAKHLADVPARRRPFIGLGGGRC